MAISLTNITPVGVIKVSSAKSNVNSDPYWDNVVMLLQPTAEDTVIEDKSQYNNLTNITNVPLVTNSLFGKSLDLLYTGASKYLTFNNSVYEFGLGDFTIEFWSKVQVKDTDTNSYLLDTSGNYRILICRIGSSTPRDGSMTFYDDGIYFPTIYYPVNEWFHTACVRSNGVFYMFINGILKVNGPDTKNITGIDSNYFGSANTNAKYVYQGYVQNFRITQGIARYTENFNVSTEPFPTN